MKMVICNPFSTKTIENPQFVPRIGDKVIVEYEPAPIVANVVWDYEKDVVVVFVH